MVGEAFSTGHHCGVNDVLEVIFVHKDKVNEVPIFRPIMHLGFFKSFLLLEDDVSGGKLLLSAKLQQQAPAVVAFTNAVSAKYTFPGICILAHSNIEITKDYHLVICRDALETTAELQVELVFFLQVRLEELERTHWKAWNAIYFLEESAWTSYGRNNRLPDFPAWMRLR